MITALSQLLYEVRLKRCKLSTLKTRGIREDQVEVFKIMHGFEDINKYNFRKMGSNVSREHNFIINKAQYQLDITNYSKLPTDCVNVTISS